MKKGVIAIIIIVITLGGVLGYIFGGRLGDASYHDAATQLDALLKNSDSITGVTKKLATPYTITDAATMTTLKTAVEAYNKADDTLAKSTIISADSTVSAAYGNDKATLTDYRKAADDLWTSLGDFNTIISACGTLQSQLQSIQTTADFDKYAKDCTDAVTAAKSAPDATFARQFLSQYITKSNALVTSYRQLVAGRAGTIATKQAAVTAANKAMADISSVRNAKLDLSLTPDPTDALQSLKSVIASQQGKFFR